MPITFKRQWYIAFCAWSCISLAIPAALLIAVAAADDERPLVVTGRDGGRTWEAFSMDPGACLRGPLRFKDAEGAVLFELQGGFTYPPGCGSSLACSGGQTFTVERSGDYTFVGCK